MPIITNVKNKVNETIFPVDPQGYAEKAGTLPTTIGGSSDIAHSAFERVVKSPSGIENASSRVLTAPHTRGNRWVIAQNVPTQIYFSDSLTVKIRIRNVLTNVCLFSESSSISSINYSRTLQGGTGTEPTAGEEKEWNSSDNIWALCTLSGGTVLTVEVDTM